jgi:hypothetical protein
LVAGFQRLRVHQQQQRHLSADALSLQRYPASASGEKSIRETGTIHTFGVTKRFLWDTRAAAFRFCR